MGLVGLIMVKEKELEFEYYVGDPCYVISDERWDEFCNALWAAEFELRKSINPNFVEEKKYISLEGCGVEFEWPLIDEWGDEYTHTIEVWSSPGGDGCWSFQNLAGHYQKNMRPMKSSLNYELGVDAGIIAVVPYVACDDKTEQMGLYFNDRWGRPTLETQEQSFEIKINDCSHDGIMECTYCGTEERLDNLSDDGYCWMCEG